MTKVFLNGNDFVSLGTNKSVPMSFGFFLATPSADISSIKLIVRHKDVRYTRAIGLSVVASKWNQKAQRARVTSDYRDGGAINFEVQRWTTAVDRLLENDPNIVDQKHFWALVDCELNAKSYEQVDPRAISFADYFEKMYIPRFKLTKSEVRTRRFKVALELFRKFETAMSRSYKFVDVNTLFYRDLEAFFLKERYSPNYFGSIVKIIKQVMREAADVDKLHTNNEFRGANFKAVAVEVDTVYLTKKELQAIDALVIDEALIKIIYPDSEYSGLATRVKSYNIAKNIFLIGSYTGLRISDLKRLRKEHFTGDTITIVTEKTGARVVIPIHPVVRKIVDGGFDFDQMLSEQKIRIYIKQICKQAGITDFVEVRRSSMGAVVVERLPKYELVGTHTARRSFATNAYKAGVPTIAIMKITGHTKESTFMKYIRISQEENADILSKHPFFN